MDTDRGTQNQGVWQQIRQREQTLASAVFEDILKSGEQKLPNLYGYNMGEALTPMDDAAFAEIAYWTSMAPKATAVKAYRDWYALQKALSDCYDISCIGVMGMMASAGMELGQICMAKAYADMKRAEARGGGNVKDITREQVYDAGNKVYAAALEIYRDKESDMGDGEGEICEGWQTGAQESLEALKTALKNWVESTEAANPDSLGATRARMVDYLNAVAKNLSE